MASSKRNPAPGKQRGARRAVQVVTANNSENTPTSSELQATYLACEFSLHLAVSTIVAEWSGTEIPFRRTIGEPFTSYADEVRHER